MHTHVLRVHSSAGVCVCVHLWVLGINDDCLPRFLYTLYVEVMSLGEPFWPAWLASLLQGIQAGCQVYAAVTLVLGITLEASPQPRVGDILNVCFIVFNATLCSFSVFI